MKVTITIPAVLVLTLLLSACGGEKQTSTPASTLAEAPPVEQAGGAAGAAPSDVLKDGLKATLQLAAERAVEELSKPGGFADNEALRVRLPASFEPVESALKKLGQQRLLDDFTNSLNEAARTSIAASPQILGMAIKGMKVEDALAIWKGGEDAATRFLEDHTRAQIEEKMLPIITEQTQSSGATRYFKQIVDLLPKGKDGLMGSLSSLSGVKIPEDFDLDDYISEKALDGLYTRLAEEEATIRANPAARTTELVKSAFDFLKKR
jgi:hypothetical protein